MCLKGKTSLLVWERVVWRALSQLLHAGLRAPKRQNATRFGYVGRTGMGWTKPGLTIRRMCGSAAMGGQVPLPRRSCLQCAVCTLCGHSEHSAVHRTAGGMRQGRHYQGRHRLLTDPFCEQKRSRMSATQAAGCPHVESLETPVLPQHRHHGEA